MKTRLIVIYAGTVQVSEIINVMTQSGLIVFHVRQTQKLDLLNKKVEWTQGQRLKDKTERKYSDSTCIVWNTQRKENDPAQSAIVQVVVRDLKVTSILCKHSILARYASLVL